MPSWVCQWKPFWIPVGESFKKAFVEEWVFVSGDSSDGQNVMTPRIWKQFDSLPWEPTRPQDKAYFWERIEAPLPPLRPRLQCNFIHPRQLNPFPERLVLPFSNEVILCGYEDIVSSGTDLFTSWVKMSDHEILVEHMVNIEKATAEFREASERKPATSHTNSANKHFPIRSIVQRRLSMCKWNPGPPRGKEDAFEKQIAGRWHNITMQEASVYVDHELLTNRFHVTHYAGCAVLFNEDTFYAKVDVKSIDLHDTRRDLSDQVMEGEQGWVMQGVLSRASFRRSPVSGQKFVSAYQQHSRQKERHRQEAHSYSPCHHDISGSWLDGTVWRYRGKDNLSTFDEVFTDCALPTPPGTTPRWWPGSIPNNWADVCGFLKPFGSERFVKLNKHGAFSIPQKTLGLRPTDQSCHHETWLHPDFVDWSNTWSKQDSYEQHISLKERPADYSYGNPKRRISEVMSDYSLSSYMCDHSHHGVLSSDLMTHLSQRGWCLAFSFFLWRVSFPYFISLRITRCTVRRCLMSKKKHANTTGNVVLCEIQHFNVNYAFFKILITSDLEESGRISCIFGSHTFVPTSWMCKKQTSVLHCSSKTEIISLDAGVRMVGLPSLDLWNLVIEVFHYSPNQSNKTKD